MHTCSIESLKVKCLASEKNDFQREFKTAEELYLYHKTSVLNDKIIIEI